MTNHTKPSIRSSIDGRYDSMVEMRRDLHQHPELGFEEVRTSGRVIERLQAESLTLRTGIAQTGITTLVDGQDTSRTILLRADMDALPIHEENEKEYRSTVDNRMHACGHDGHTTILTHAVLETLGFAAPPTVNTKFLFQPAEEGPGGALPMIKEGVLSDPEVEAAFGLHLWNDLEIGKVAVTSGHTMAAADEFEIVITGKGGHAAYPHQCVDSVVVGSYIVTALQTLVSRNVDPIRTAVISIGAFHAGHAFNVLAHTATLRGTLRTFDTELRSLLIGRLRQVVVRTAESFGAEAEFRFVDGYPAVYNDPEMAEFVAEIATEVVGTENVVRDMVSMGGEDMAFFLDRVPGCFFFVGSMDPPQGLDFAHHHPRFDFAEGAMPIGVEMFLRIQERYALKFPDRPVAVSR